MLIVFSLIVFARVKYLPILGVLMVILSMLMLNLMFALNLTAIVLVLLITIFKLVGLIFATLGGILSMEQVCVNW